MYMWLGAPAHFNIHGLSMRYQCSKYLSLTTTLFHIAHSIQPKL